MFKTKFHLPTILVGIIWTFGITANAQTTNDNITSLDQKDVKPILSMISSAPAVAFDLTPAGVTSLKASGVSDQVIVAMFQKANPDLTNEKLLGLQAAGMSTSEIVRLVQATDPAHAKFDASVVGLANLRAGGINAAAVEAVNQKMNPIIDPDEDLPILAALGARITGGVIIGNGHAVITPAVRDSTGAITVPATIRSPQFSEAASYLAFEAQPVIQPWNKNVIRNISISPILNARLTTIAVAGVSEVSAPTNAFLSSQKAAQFQFGAAIEYHILPFSMGSRNFRWAAGPIGRYMPQSITDSERSTRIWNLHDDLFEAYTFGGRMSLYHEREIGSKTQWRPAAYVDFSWGRFENFETATGNTPAATACLLNPALCLEVPQDKKDYQTHNSGRLYIESRVVLKYTYFGLDLNSGNGRDDVRFIVGISVALDRFFKK